ncbi:MAG TPA: sulfatase [Candidatus Binatia bacterium]|nr:sulfatase [Candidatus Binatia bacterium]
MIAGLSVLACTLLVASWHGYGGVNFAGLILTGAAAAAAPVFVIWALERTIVRAVSAARPWAEALGTLAQSSFLLAAFGWRWLEPHAVLTAWTGGTLHSRWYLAAAGALVGAAVHAATRRMPAARAIVLAMMAAFLIAGGDAYRAADHVAAGERATAAGVIAAAAMAATLALWAATRLHRSAGVTFFALAAAAGCAAVVLPRPVASSRAASESVFLVVVDTLRADAAGVQGPSWMPQLARIAREGTRFGQAISPAPWTLPATLSLLSGWNPHRHLAGVSVSPWEVLPGDAQASFLGPALRDAGYVVAAFVNNPYLRPHYGFGSGHLVFRAYHGRAEDGAALALDWQHRIGSRRFFTMLHIMDPHWPFEAPAGAGAAREPCQQCDSLSQLQYTDSAEPVRQEVRRRYRAEVEYTDARLGELYDALTSAGHLEDAWFIVTSDHGEELWDHGGFLHGHTLYDELLRVPLVIVPPRSRQGVQRGNLIGWQVRLEDVAATMLEVCGLDPLLARDGRSLLPMLQTPRARPAAPHMQISGFVKSPVDMRYAVRGWLYKAIVTPENPFATEVFQLFTDARETQNLLSPQADALARLVAANSMQQLVDAARRTGLQLERKPAVQAGSMPDADLRRQLESLGYAD